MRDELDERIQDALDSPEGLEGDLDLQRAFVEDREASDFANELARVDGALRDWPEPERSESHWDALATRIEQRLDDALPAMPDPTVPPAFGEGAAPPPVPRPRRDSNEFSLSNLAKLGVEEEPLEIDVEAEPEPARRLVPRTDDRFSFSDLPPRGGLPPAFITLDAPPAPDAKAEERPSGTGRRWALAGFAAAAVVGLGVVVGLTLSESQPAAGELAVVTSEPSPEGERAVAAAVPEGARGQSAEAADREPSEAEASAEPSSPAAGPAAEPTEPSPETTDPTPETEEAAPSSGATRRATAERAARPAERARRAPARETEPRQQPSAASEAGAGASPRRRATAREEAEAPANLPQTPSREQVLAALRAVEPQVQACAQGARHGVASVRITVGNNGRVRGALVQGEFAGTAEGSCVARAVRRARFPRFRQDTFEVTFPFRI